MFNVTTNKDAVSTGNREVAEMIGGSILPGSLVVVNGESKSGKSVFCQHLAFNALLSQNTSAIYYTVYSNFNELINQMDSLSMDVQHHFVTDKLRICPLNSIITYSDLERSVQYLVSCINGLPARFNLVIIDSFTPFIAAAPPKVKMDAFKAFRELCGSGRSVILVSDNYAYERETLPRVYLMSDYYLKMSSDEVRLWGEGEMDNRVVKILDVRKLRGAEIPAGEAIKFEIKPGAGIQVLPFLKVRV